ncbi:MAG: hypothetical protein LBQ35_00475 [Spirochaetaceae bacterium]|jgi:hypothetical protein|nr:hypothetical protein [Spirochaetaceae bacterium]
MRKLIVIVVFLAAPAILFSQSRDDVSVYVAPTTGGKTEDQIFFNDNIKMEVMGANYLVVDNPAAADYTINLNLSEEEDWDDPYAMVNILNISLVDNSDGHEVVQFAWEYRDIEEMYQWNLQLIYQAMANVPLTKLTAVPDTNHWRNKWLYLVALGYADFQFGFFDEDLIPEDEKRTRAAYTFYLSPAIGLMLEFQFLNFMSLEAGFVGAQQNFGNEDLAGLKFALPVLLKFPLKPSRHFMLEPYGGIQANLSTGNQIRPTVFSWVGGFQYGVRGGERGALIIDLRVTGDIPLGSPSNSQVYTTTSEQARDWVNIDSLDIYFGIGFKIGFYNRNKTDEAAP